MIILNRLIIFFILSYGMLFFSYKYYLPALGGNDFHSYAKMYLNPLDFTQASSPFIYRQLSALITNLVYEIGIPYNLAIFNIGEFISNIDTSFSDSEISKELFFATILSNYLGITMTALMVSKTVDLYIKNSYLFPVLGGILCFLSFGVSSFVLTEMTEGWAWFLISVAFYSLKSRNLKLFLFILSISIFQRETVSIIFGVFSSIYFVYYLKFNKNKFFENFYLKSFLISLGAFITHIAIRKVIIPVDGNYSSQLSPSAWVDAILQNNYFEISYISAVFLLNNLLYLLIFLLLLLIFKYKKNPSQLYIVDFTAILATIIGLFWVGTAAGVSGNIGRHILALSPIICVLITYYFYSIEERTKKINE